MLPYNKFFLIFFTRNCLTDVNEFLFSHSLPVVRGSQVEGLFGDIFETYDDKALKGFKAVSKRSKLKDKTKSYLTKLLSETFDLEIDEERNLEIPRNTSRILNNRELRVFIEILILGGCDSDFIAEVLPEKYRLSPPLSSLDIMEYSNLFFDYHSMDDLDWQKYLVKLKDMYELTEDKVYLQEYEDKMFALRHKTSEIIIRLGLKGQLKYSEMLSYIGVRVFDEIVQGFEKGKEWKELKSNIDTFKSVGEAFKKYHDPSEDEEAFTGTEYEIETDSIEKLPILNDNVLEYLSEEESS